MKRKFIKLLKRAHAIEIGAYHAYKGHYINTKDSWERAKIRFIRVDEACHRIDLEFILYKFDEKSDKIQDSILWLIGKTISAGCYIFPRKAAMWGAKIMEILGSKIYYKLADAARDAKEDRFVLKLLAMAKQEWQHEEFFKNALKHS